LAETSLLSFARGEVEISNTTISHFNSTAITVKSASTFKLIDSVIEYGKCSEYCAAYIQNSDTSLIVRSTIRHNTASVDAAGLGINSQSGYKGEVEVRDSTFFNNSGAEEGALVLDVSKGLVTRTTFLENSSRDNAGGGLTVLCDDNSNCAYTLSYNNFTRNSAKFKGGAVYWTWQPKLENNSFSNNSAEYGADLASYGVSLEMLGSQASQQRLNKEASEKLTNFASGQKIPFPIRIGLVDHYGQIVTTDNSSECDLLPQNPETTAISGETRVSASRGVYEFTDVIVTSEPGTTVGFKVSSAVLASPDSMLSIQVQLRLCNPGEALVGTSCSVCDYGTYSLDPSEACKDCPDGADCYGGSIIVPKAGYWRSSKRSDKVLKCKWPLACEGSPSITPSLTGRCAVGYRGNLCQPCEDGYSRSAENKCSMCPSYAENVAILFGLSILVVSVCAILVRTTLKTAYVPKAKHSIALKILTNYLQLVLLTTQLNLDWPHFVQLFFKSQNYADSASSQLFSFECFLAGDNPSGDEYKITYFKQLILMSCLPIIIVAFASCYWVIVYYYTRKRSILRKELVTTFVVLFFLVHPSLLKHYFAVFSCSRLDTDSLWLTHNLDIKCFDDNHSVYAFAVAFPSILIWGAGVPSGILCFLIKRRRELKSIKMKCKFGFFYNGYRLSHFYWEFLILYRKIIIISLVVFVGNYSVKIQALTIMAVLFGFLCLQYWQEPFNDPQLNRLELKAIFVAGVTIYCGLYYLTDEAPEGFKIILFLLMIAANASFFYSLALFLLSVIIKSIGKKFGFFKKLIADSDAFSDIDITSSSVLRPQTYLTEDKMVISSMIPLKEPAKTARNEHVLTQLVYQKMLQLPGPPPGADQKSIAEAFTTYFSETTEGDISFSR